MIVFLLQAVSLLRNTPDITDTIHTNPISQAATVPIHHHICSNLLSEQSYGMLEFPQTAARSVADLAGRTVGAGGHRNAYPLSVSSGEGWGLG